MELYCSLLLGICQACTGEVGAGEDRTPVLSEALLGYYPCLTDALTQACDPGRGQCLTGSLTGAVAS